IKNFGAFVVSFGFIGMYWYRHLRLCGLLTDYNRTFVALNLGFLFFIVLFPFSVSSMMRLSPELSMVAAMEYFANILLTTIMHFILYLYLFGKGKTICRPLSEKEKKYLLQSSFTPIILILVIVSTFLLAVTVGKDNNAFSFLIFLPAIAIV